MESYAQSPYPVDVSCKQIESSLLNSNDELLIEIGWEAATFPNSRRLLATIQRQVIVEYSAIAVAFLLISEVTRCAIVSVPRMRAIEK